MKNIYPSNCAICLVPPTTIHFVQQFPSALHAPHILPRQLECTVDIRICIPTHVRSDETVGRRPQRVISRKRLRIRNIECCAADLFCFQGFDERRLVYDWTSRNVGNKCPLWVTPVKKFKLVGG